MPRNAKGRRKSKNRGLSEASKKKLDAIGEDTQEETLDGWLADFEIQTETFVKQAKRTYTITAKKALQVLHTKSAYPKDILKMPASEFKMRGGSLAAVMESLKAEKQGGTVATFIELNNKQQGVCTAGAADLEKENKLVDPQAFVTPAMNTRSQARSGQTTAKRMPKPMERVTMTTCSSSTGSPLDERTFLQLQLDQAVEDMKSKILETSTSFPQKWRSQLMKALKSCKSQIYFSQEQELLTPALQR